MNKMLFTLVLTLAPGVAMAQMPGDPSMPLPIQNFPQLVKYLGLDVKQSTELLRVNLEFQRYLAVKTQRVAMVDAELHVETLKDVVDPMALGVRYAELEAICREARDTEKKTQESALKLLTAAQLAKMQVLEQASALLPVIAEADAAHLMNAPLTGMARSAGAILMGVQIGNTAGLPGCRYFANPGGMIPMPLQPGMGPGGQ